MAWEELPPVDARKPASAKDQKPGGWAGGSCLIVEYLPSMWGLRTSFCILKHAVFLDP